MPSDELNNQQQLPAIYGWEAFKIDLQRKRQHYTRIDNFVNRYIKMTLQWGSLAVLLFRLRQAIFLMDDSFLKTLFKIVLKPFSMLMHILTDVVINPQSKISAGLVVHNFFGIVLDPEFAGNNLTVNQNVCISNDAFNSGRPKLGKNVFVGAGAKILGDISIGDNVVIAANSLVIDSIPSNCSVVGIPARVVYRGTESEYLSFST